MSPNRRFVFSIGSNGYGAFALYLHAVGNDRPAMVLIGHWPTLEEAQEIAARIESRMLRAVEIPQPLRVWTENPSAAE